MRLKPLKNPALLALASIKTGIVLMVAVVVASMVGTVFPYERSLELVFYSSWFRLLLLALAVNLTVCTYQTLATRVFPLLKPRFPKSKDHYEAGPLRFSFASSRSAEEVAALFRNRGFRAARQGDYLCIQKGRLRLFAAPLVHFGFILVLIGGFGSGFLALDGRIRLNEGESTTMMIIPAASPDGQATTRPLGFEVTCLEFDTANFPRTQIPSRYISTIEIRDGERRFVDTVEVNKSVKHRGLKFHQSGYGPVPNKVRHRLRVADSAASRTAEVAVAAAGRAPVADWGVDLQLRQTVAGLRYSITGDGEGLAGGYVGADRSDLAVKAERFVPHFMIGPDRQVQSRSDQMNNPALQVSWMNGQTAMSKQWLFQRPDLRGFSHREQDEIRLELERTRKTADDETYEFELAARDAGTNALLTTFTMRLGQTVRLADFATTTGAARSERFDVNLLATEPLQYTDLSVSANPMIPVIYFGSILACAAIFLALYMRRVTAWVWCDTADGRLRLAVQYAPERSTLTAGMEKVVAALENRKT